MAEVFDCCMVVDALQLQPVSGNKPVKQANGADHVGRAREADEAFTEHEEWMVTANVVGTTIFHQGSPDSIGSTGRPLMDEVQVLEAPCTPAEAVGFHFVPRVPAGRTQKTADSLPTILPVNLCRTPDMESRGVFVGLLVSGYVADDAAPDTQLAVTT